MYAPNGRAGPKDLVADAAHRDVLPERLEVEPAGKEMNRQAGQHGAGQDERGNEHQAFVRVRGAEEEESGGSQTGEDGHDAEDDDACGQGGAEHAELSMGGDLAAADPDDLGGEEEGVAVDNPGGR